MANTIMSVSTEEEGKQLEKNTEKVVFDKKYTEVTFRGRCTLFSPLMKAYHEN